MQHQICGRIHILLMFDAQNKLQQNINGKGEVVPELII
jgi:hypothetical protein